ncbi:MAG TPA: phage holin family protein [Casimicrobiaceae bacterium]|nr:phage holin family protein [Casimicrobiaceae bacterium]
MDPTYAQPLRPTSMTTGSRLSLAFANVKALVQDHALLAVLEVQRAGVSLVKMIAAGIVISILVVSAWMGIVAAIVGFAIGQGANWALAILIAALVNIGIAVAIAFYAKKQVPDLLFAATLRQLKRDVPGKEDEHHGS